MTPLTRLAALAIPLLEDNVDTDMIFPARFLLILERAGLAHYAFHDRRFDADGNAVPGFAFNQPRFDAARVLIGGANFGTGSSREQAVWCLADRNIRCVIAISMGDIFRSNCVNNGVLPVVLARPVVEALARTAEAGLDIAVDLEGQSITAAGIGTVSFEIDADAREMLLNGWDATDLVLDRHRLAIARHEARRSVHAGWMKRQGG